MKKSLIRYARIIFTGAVFIVPALTENCFAVDNIPSGRLLPVLQAEESCCGPVTPAAQKVLAVLDQADVEHLWLNHRHVNWVTGKPDRPDNYSGPGDHTHCSAFAAAIGARLGVYMLRPPQHSQILLASAQTRWFDSSEGRKSGWVRVSDVLRAQQLANRGMLVVISYENPDRHRPGHIVIVRPSLISPEALRTDGPYITQAGTRNMTAGKASVAFSGHPGAWPDGVKLFAHAIPE